MGRMGFIFGFVVSGFWGMIWGRGVMNWRCYFWGMVYWYVGY